MWMTSLYFYAHPPFYYGAHGSADAPDPTHRIKCLCSCGDIRATRFQSVALSNYMCGSCE